jgi:hypothetical protein
VPPEDFYHLRAVWWTIACSTKYLSSFPEIGRSHYSRGYDGELFYIVEAEVIEAVNRPTGNA